LGTLPIKDENLSCEQIIFELNNENDTIFYACLAVPGVEHYSTGREKDRCEKSSFNDNF